MQKFWQKVNIKGENDCWEWTAGLRNGYGCFKYQGKTVDAHRISFFITHGYFPNKLVCHTCDNRKCINPKHLFEGTYRDNNLDGIKKGRMKPWTNSPYNKKGCISKLRKFTEEQIIDMRKKYSTGKYTMQNLANEYKINKGRISLIINYKSYSNITDSSNW